MTLPQRIVLALLVLVGLYGLWRWHRLDQLQLQVREEESAQRRFMATLAMAAQDNQPLPPNPKPDTSGWLANQALRGLEKRLTSNTPSAAGAGAEVKLHNLQPTEVVGLLKQMTKVNLVVRRLVLANYGKLSRWDLEFIVEVPKPEADK